MESSDLTGGRDEDRSPQHMLPSLLVFDLDGTLLGAQREPLPSALAALEHAREEGVRVALASGRDPFSVKAIAEHAGMHLDGLVLIGRNGSVIVDAATGQEIWSAPLPPDLLARVVRHAADFPVTVTLPAGPDLYAVDRDAHYVQSEAQHSGQRLIILPSLERPPVPITKVLMAAAPDELVAVAEDLAAPFTDELTFVFSTPFFLEATLAGVDKGSALVRLCEEEGLDIARSVAFGDQENDVAMLRAAGLGVAMDNAVPAAKEAADVVIGHHDSDTIAELLRERFGLG